MTTTHHDPTDAKNQKQPELADIFRLYADDYRRSHPVAYEQLKVMHHIQICRTAALGGHVEQCDQCAFEQIAYNSCRDRHCPKCQTLTKEKWLNERKAELLPCGYFHLVFTLPHTLNPIILSNKKTTLNILFAAVNQTLQAFASDPQWRLEGRLGFISVLHTWSQTLIDHFHIHCLIAAGALSFTKDKWIPANDDYLFKITSLAKAFKNCYLKLLVNAYDKDQLIFTPKTAALKSRQAFKQLINGVSKKRWIAYAKRPFAGPRQVLEYLGRYTHRVAISNYRIISIDNRRVTFTYRDRQNDDQIKKMTLDAAEFIRRFLLHVLPKGFFKIRYFGFLSHTNKKQLIPLIRKLIDVHATLPEKIKKESISQMMLRLTGIDISCCPKCKKGKMIAIRKLPIQDDLKSS
jgi:predicted Zn-ribbon and HTH transcriptional regulator